MHTMPGGGRSGFTIIEMLMASVIFLLGFVAVYGLFLSGVKFRRESENLTRGAVASSSIIAMIRLRCRAAVGLSNPAAYNGDGDPTTDDGDLPFHAFMDQPGLFYRVTGCQFLFGGDAPSDPSPIKLQVQTVFLGSSAPTLSAKDVCTRLGWEDQDITKLVERGLIHEQAAVIYRH